MTATWLLIALFVLLLAIGTPVGMSLGASALAAWLLTADASPMLAVQRLYAGADSFPLLAVPLFIMAGEIMSAGGISRRIVRLADALVGHLPGNLGLVCVTASMIFAGISGSAAADVAAVGAIMIPALVRRGYAPARAAALQAAAGSMGVIIPPSIPAIIYGALSGASVSRLFMAGLLPGLLMAVSLSLVWIWLHRHENSARRPFSGRELKAALADGVWALGVPIVVLTGIFSGMSTATESAALALAYAALAGLFIYKELTLKNIPNLILSAGVMSGVVMFMICAANMFGWLLTFNRASEHLVNILLAFSRDPGLLLLFINVILLLAGCLLETTAALILFVPVFLPLIPPLGISEVQFGVIIILNLAIGMLTPPVGVCLFVSCALGKVELAQVSRAVLPFLLILMLDLVLVCTIPALTTLHFLY